MSTFFTVGAVDDPPALLLVADDDIDLRTVAVAGRDLSAVVGSGGPEAVLIDVTDRFVAARGVRLLVDAVQRGRAADQHCVVAGLHPHLLDMLGLFDAEGLPLYGTVEEAVATLRRGRGDCAGG